MRSSWTRMLVSTAILAGVAAACDGSNEPTAERSRSGAVSISGFLFRPGAVRIARGSAVTWTSRDDIAHTITAGAPGAPIGAFDSGDKVKGETFSHTFSSTGTFPYFCRNHTSMRGEVTVT